MILDDQVFGIGHNLCDSGKVLLVQKLDYRMNANESCGSIIENFLSTTAPANLFE